MVIGGTGPETEEEKEKLEASREKSHALGLEECLEPRLQISSGSLSETS